MGSTIRQQTKRCVVCFQLLNPNEKNLHKECAYSYVTTVLKENNIDTDKIGDFE
jgi:hypothetical protein